MADENLSKFYDSIVLQPASLSSLNESSDFEPSLVKNCSTPIIKTLHLKTLLSKRKTVTPGNTACKLRKIELNDINSIATKSTSDSSASINESSSEVTILEKPTLIVGEENCKSPAALASADGNQEDLEEVNADTVSQRILECLENLSQEKIYTDTDVVHEIRSTAESAEALPTKDLKTVANSIKSISESKDCFKNLRLRLDVGDQKVDSFIDHASTPYIKAPEKESCMKADTDKLKIDSEIRSCDDTNFPSSPNTDSQVSLEPYSSHSAETSQEDSCSSSDTNLLLSGLEYNKTYCNKNLLGGSMADVLSADDKSCSSKDYFSLGVSLFDDDDVLLQSSSEDEEDVNIESFYHLLDSPSESEEDENNVTVIENPALPVVSKVDSTNSVKPQTSPTTAKQSCDSSNRPNISQINMSWFTPRSALLKQYIKEFKNSQQKRYPAWLERAKKSCSREELENLMRTVYDPTNYNNPGRFVLESLSVNNYRHALQFSGVNPDKLPRNSMVSDFYYTSPANSYRRFGVN